MNEKDQILISSYLDGEISEEEEKIVQDLLENDEQAQIFYQELQSASLDLNQIFETKTVTEIKKNLYHEAISLSSKKTFFRRILIAVAAVAATPLLVLSPVGFLADNSNDTKNESFYELPPIDDNTYDKQIYSEDNITRAVRDEKKCIDLEVLKDELNLETEDCKSEDLKKVEK